MSGGDVVAKILALCVLYICLCVYVSIRVCISESEVFQIEETKKAVS